MRQARTASKYLLAIFMIVAGTMHFVNPTFFLLRFASQPSESMLAEPNRRRGTGDA